MQLYTHDSTKYIDNVNSNRKVSGNAIRIRRGSNIEAHAEKKAMDANRQKNGSKIRCKRP